MDSRSRLTLLLLALMLIAKSAHAQTTDPNQCDWSCGKISKQSKDAQLKDQYTQVQSFLGGQSTCALPTNFDRNQNLSLGAYQALAIAAKNCDVKKDTKVKNVDNFLYQSLALQGLKLFQNKDDPNNPVPNAQGPLTPSNFYDLASQMAEEDKKSDKDPTKKTWCMQAVHDFEPLKSGDILAGRDDTLVIDFAGTDPYGIKSHINGVKDHLNLGAKATDNDIRAKMHSYCDDWVTDGKDFHITVFHAGGRAKLFPTYGNSSSPWLATVSESALAQCYKEVSDAIIEESFPATADVRKSAFISPLHGSLSGIKVLRHSDSDACRIGRNSIPTTLDGLTCVQCCQEDK